MASITQLSIFHKNTDATATERGYEFQKLKTIESWLKNKVSGKKEVIYYDYEDDIFQRDINNLKSTFRQLKLYSSNFSFASEEIKKAIIHFFTLYCQGEYLLDNIKFVFEANSNIARNYDGNDAKLLKEWHENQDDLQGEILDKCISKIKEIIFDFVDSIKDGKPELLKAKQVFEKLKDNEVFWQDLTKSIYWNFEGIEPEEAMANSLKEIDKLISQLPFSIEEYHAQNIINSLHFHVSQSATMERPEDRLLNDDLLEQIIFKVLGGEDAEYGVAIDKYRESQEIDNFVLGKLYESISWSRYYRQHKNLNGHKKIWINVLTSYLDNSGTPEFCKKDILYELIYLKLQPTLNFKFKESDSSDIDTLSHRYFELVPVQFNDTNTIEDAVNLYSIIRTANKLDIIDIQDDFLDESLSRLETSLQDKIKTEKINEKCSYLESYSFLQLTLKYPKADNKDEVFKKSISIIREIISLNPLAPLYSYSNLYERINGILKGLIQIGYSENDYVLIDELETLSEELVPIVEEREGRFSLAKKYRDRAVEYLQFSKRRKDLLKALNYFHKAKILLFQEETKESFILVLMNISQVYNAIGFNIAAKYYALASFYVAIGKEDYFDKTVKSIAMIHHYDFNQGAWISCMMDIELFIKNNGEFVDNWDIKENITLRKVLLDYSFILFGTPILSAQTSFLVNQKLNELGFLKEDYMDMFIDNLKSELPTKKAVIDLVKGKITDFPLNDLGSHRKVQFYAFEFLWIIEFENDFESNILGEEFCAIFQILLTELRINFKELAFKDNIKVINIILEKGDGVIPPEKTENINDTIAWKVSLPKTEKPKPYYPSILSMLINIMRELVEDNVNISEVFLKLNRDYELGSKATIVQPYDKLYKTLFSEENYNVLMRTAFENVIFEEEFVQVNDVVI